MARGMPRAPPAGDGTTQEIFSITRAVELFDDYRAWPHFRCLQMACFGEARYALRGAGMAFLAEMAARCTAPPMIEDSRRPMARASSMQPAFYAQKHFLPRKPSPAMRRRFAMRL